MLGFSPLADAPLAALSDDSPAAVVPVAPPPFSLPHDDYDNDPAYRRLLDTRDAETARKARLAQIRRDIGLDKEPDVPLAPRSEIVIADAIIEPPPPGPSFDPDAYAEVFAASVKESVLAADQAEAAALLAAQQARADFIREDNERVLTLLAAFV